jgi:hypothetical protein
MKLTRLAGGCGENGVCPAVDLTDQGTVVFTGPIALYDGLRAGPGEQSVELTVDMVREAMRALDIR